MSRRLARVLKLNEHGEITARTTWRKVFEPIILSDGLNPKTAHCPGCGNTFRRRTDSDYEYCLKCEKEFDK